MPVGPTTQYAVNPNIRAAVNDGSGFGLGLQAGAEVELSRDGTPSRIAGVLLLAGGALALLRFSGIRFNVGVSS